MHAYGILMQVLKGRRWYDVECRNWWSIYRDNIYPHMLEIDILRYTTMGLMLMLFDNNDIALLWSRINKSAIGIASASFMFSVVVVLEWDWAMVGVGSNVGSPESILCCVRQYHLSTCTHTTCICAKLFFFFGFW